MLSAHDSEADIEFDPRTSNPHFSYIEDDGKHHDVWFLDGVTAYNEIHAADDYRPAGYALWRLGSEDPSVWSVLGRNYGAPAPDALRTHRPARRTSISKARARCCAWPIAREPGSRTLRDRQRRRQHRRRELYDACRPPTSFSAPATCQGKLALTFDDGPDPEWTPQILDILKAKGVHASFFIIGENADAYPDLVQRDVAEGHDVGNHTFTHPNLGERPDALVTLEINATQRLFEAITGRSMRLFRAPYFGDAEPTTADEIVPIEIAQAMGYHLRRPACRPERLAAAPADEIVAARAQPGQRSQSRRPAGKVMLLHDSGGDRSATVAALAGADR